ncbi:MAG: shikimate kinase [Ruminococcaceae bacterium]|nr:shikimate kinase [Oscillospiraceae bacterium]
MRCGLLGEHLGHSFSPEIHEALADYSYELAERAPEEVGEFVKNGGFDAFNVTIPYKKAVIPFLNEISPEAQRIGAVNTVVRRPDGSLAGYNTDYFGFDGMLTAAGIDVRGKKTLILGNGGASLTVQAVLADRGADEIVVVDIGLPDNYDNLDRHFDAQVIVNATPVGMYPHNGKSLVTLSDFPRCEGVLDVIYNPARTALLLQAEERGIPAMNGLYMLVAQAAKAFEYFTGDTAEEGVVEAVTRQIAHRTRNIVLIGMPGCGKSTVGKRLAEKLGRPFYDADTEFSAMHGLTPAQAIEQYGEPRFRELEHETLCALGKASGTVIACGGGVVTREKNYAPLHQNGIIVYLRRELSRLATGGRPLSQRMSVETLYAARKDAYERFADLTVDSTEVVEKTVSAMTAMLAESDL